MALTLETGEGLSNSDTFVELAEARAFAASRGGSLPENDAEAEVLLRKATDYLVSLEHLFQGVRAQDDQALPFPRCGVVVHNRCVEDNEIPATLKTAVMWLALEMQNADLLPTQDGRVVISESVGPISTTYQAGGATTANPSYPRVDAYLAPLMRQSGGLSTLRV